MASMILTADSVMDLKPFEALAQKMGILVEYAKKEKSAGKENYRGYGSLKGQIRMMPDFDEPIEDFKDYM